MTEVLTIIPARGGSKSIPKKNIRKFLGKPLISYSIETGLESKLINRVIVSTDNKEIAKIAKKCGAEVPFMRPSKYAQDSSLDLPVFIHALKWLRKNEKYTPDIVVHLRPTSPIRSAKKIDEAIKLLIDNPKADSVRGVIKPSQNPFKMWIISPNDFMIPLVKTKYKEAYNMPRQKLPDVFWQTGYVDVIRPKVILSKHSMSGNYILPLFLKKSDQAVDIDTPEDWRKAEIYFEQTKSKLGVNSV